jgi:hypothetical protein
MSVDFFDMSQPTLEANCNPLSLALSTKAQGQVAVPLIEIPFLKSPAHQDTQI